MSIGSIVNLSASYLQSILGSALQGTGSASNTGSTTASANQGQPDNGQLSPFAELLNTLQQLQQSNPTQYQQVTQQIATNLKNAAQTATSEGNTTAAAQLNQLATDFTNASQSGQLPNVQDLAQAIGGGGHHHHHHGDQASASSGATSTSSTDTTSAGSTSPLDQLLAALQSNTVQNDRLNARTIITDTLASAGITA